MRFKVEFDAAYDMDGSFIFNDAEIADGGDIVSSGYSDGIRDLQYVKTMTPQEARGELHRLETMQPALEYCSMYWHANGLWLDLYTWALSLPDWMDFIRRGLETLKTVFEDQVLYGQSKKA